MRAVSSESRVGWMATSVQLSAERYKDRVRINEAPEQRPP